MATNPEYIAAITGAEVSLLGEADLDFWRERLAKENLTPIEVEGKAAVSLSGIDSRYMGMRFRELVLTVQLDGDDSVFLLQAYNTNRFFTFVERFSFKTPYRRAQVMLEAAPPAFIQMAHASGGRIEARMSDLRTTTDVTEAHWEGKIFLPARGTAQRYFIARLEGATQVTRFDATSDRFEVNLSDDDPALEMLIASKFRPTEWRLRSEAHHARSKTFQA